MDDDGVHMGAETSEEIVDRELGAILDELITAIQETKQAAWSLADVDTHAALESLRSFLAGQVVVVAEAEARIGGRSRSILPPTGHRPPDLAHRAHGDRQALLAMLLADLESVVADLRDRSQRIAGSGEAEVVTALADGIDERLVPLRR